VATAWLLGELFDICWWQAFLRFKVAAWRLACLRSGAP